MSCTVCIMTKNKKNGYYLILLFVIIFIAIILVCSVSNQNVEPTDGTQFFLTKDFNVKPSPIVPVVPVAFTTENVNAAPVILGSEIQATKPIPIQETMLPRVDIKPADVLFTIEPTPKQAPIIIAGETKATLEQLAAIRPTQVNRAVGSEPFTIPSDNLRPPKE